MMKFWMRSLLALFLLSGQAFAIVDVPEEELVRGPGLPEEVFAFSSLDEGNGSYLLEWQIRPWYYMYQNKFMFKADNPNVRLETTFSDNSVIYADEFFGDLAIFRDYVQVRVKAIGNEAPVNMQITYQGCWDGGVCYPAENIQLSLASLISPEDAAAAPSSAANFSSAPSAATLQAKELDFAGVVSNQADQQSYTNFLSTANILLLLVVFYLAGLALAFTPCVFPTIPLVSGLITRQSENITPLKGTAMMLVFVLSMALTYALAGMLAGMLGHNLQVILQQTWIIVLSAALFLFLTGAMFGLYTLQMPLWLQNRFNALSGKQNASSFWGLGLMGVFSALIVGPCLTAPLAGVLIYLADKGDPLLGAVALFSLGIGMGTPLLLVGAFAGKMLPKAGGWMERIQHMFGFGMLLMTVWMLDRILEDDLVLLLYGMVLIAFSAYLLSLARGMQQKGKEGIEVLARAIGIILLVFGITQVIGFGLGSTDVFQPLKVLGSGSVRAEGSAGVTAEFPVVKTSQGLDEHLAQAQSLQRPVLLKFEADWCVECKVIEKEVFSDRKVINALGTVYLLAVDVTEAGDESKGLLERYRIPGPPAIVLYDGTGKRRDDLLLLGNITSKKLIQRLQNLGV